MGINAHRDSCVADPEGYNAWSSSAKRFSSGGRTTSNQGTYLYPEMWKNKLMPGNKSIQWDQVRSVSVVLTRAFARGQNNHENIPLHFKEVGDVVVWGVN